MTGGVDTCGDGHGGPGREGGGEVLCCFDSVSLTLTLHCPPSRPLAGRTLHYACGAVSSSKWLQPVSSFWDGQTRDVNNTMRQA
jgi:hypothetical protein